MFKICDEGAYDEPVSPNEWGERGVFKIYDQPESRHEEHV